MNNLRGINKGAFKWWQMLYRCARCSVNILDKRTMANNAYRATPHVMLHQYPKALVLHQRMGMWCESLLSTSCLQAQLRSFATKVKNVRFDKFGRKVDNARINASGNRDANMNKMDNLPKFRAPKRVSSSRSRIRSGHRDDAKQCTARHQKVPVRLAPEYSHSKLAKKLYLKNKFLLQRKNNTNKRKTSYNAKKSTNSMNLHASKRKRTKENLNKSERDDLKHLLADLLDKKPKLNKSENFEYVKTSPIFKLMAHNAERRNSLRGKSFQKQLEIPNFFQHPLGKCDHRKIHITRRTPLFPTENQFEKRTKEALKRKLCFLLQDGKDQDDDDEDDDVD
ncbi:uncharacterized protein LOC117783864 [Drosophila innubila]|uniref:uncharacterized protein LOC117783864 n=1 Tax=Drosophila innubila TaxID=198719 RepID=UPI00148C93EC|nr:uncharacterized protein LOC117783864 [Drosophila innubila]